MSGTATPRYLTAIGIDGRPVNTGAPNTAGGAQSAGLGGVQTTGGPTLADIIASDADTSSTGGGRNTSQQFGGYQGGISPGYSPTIDGISRVAGLVPGLGSWTGKLLAFGNTVNSSEANYQANRLQNAIDGSPDGSATSTPGLFGSISRTAPGGYDGMYQRLVAQNNDVPDQALNAGLTAFNALGRNASDNDKVAAFSKAFRDDPSARGYAGIGDPGLHADEGVGINGVAAAASGNQGGVGGGGRSFSGNTDGQDHFGASHDGFANGGQIFGSSFYLRRLMRGSGMVHGASPGRADALHTNLPKGAYVVPADAVSALGQGNSLAGGRALTGMVRKHGAFRDGGHVEQAMPVQLSGGEYVIHPHHLTAIGGGSNDRGAQVMNHVVAQARQAAVQHAMTAPPPK